MGKVIAKPLPSREDLERVFDLDSDAGVLRWRRRDDVPENWNAKYAGKVAGDPSSNGRARVGLHHARYAVHRIIFKMAYGTEPPEIDHEDTDFTNNRPSNLRAADHGSNVANGKRRRKASDLPKGVGLKKTGRYYAYIRKNGIARHLGYFDDAESAHPAYCAAAIKVHGEFARFD